MSDREAVKRSLRVGVLFGGRSGEHEVSLASARNVMDALEKAGHTVVPMGITPQGRWLTQNDPMRQLTGETMPVHTPSLGNGPMPANGQQRNGAYAHEDDSHAASAYNTWSLLPQATQQAPLPEIDIIFPVLHGTYGEDGTVQGLLEMANLPYVGCGVLASAAAMDKVMAKQLFAQAGLHQVAYEVVMRRRWQQEPAAIVAQLEQALAYPLFVKPANLGSSVGVSKAHDQAELGVALDLACRYDRKILVEAAVPNAREIEVSVLGNDDPIVSIAGEVVPGHEFYDYEAKYLDESSKLVIPAAISAELLAQVQQIAIAAFRVVDGAGLARVDFLLDNGSQTLYLNEINTMPGFTRSSMYPKLWEASGLDYPALVDRLLALALERYSDQQQNCTARAL
ncbi:MAG: D-alanine--D-alanine ligase family protein [Caldilineaceae bacterium]